MATPTDHIESGLQKRAASERAYRRRRLELLARAPKDLAALLALSKRTNEKLARIRERELALGQLVTDTRARAEAEAKDVIREKRAAYIQAKVDAAVAAWREKYDTGTDGKPGDALRLYGDVFDAHELAQALIPSFNSAVGLLQLRTSTGDDATKRRDMLALLGTAGPSEVRNQIGLSVAEGSRARLSAVIQRINGIDDPDMRRELMGEAEDAASILVGPELAASRAAIAVIAADHAGAAYHSAALRGTEIGEQEAITVGLLRRQANRLVEMVGNPAEPQAE
jgi:hypothetical protein